MPEIFTRQIGVLWLLACLVLLAAAALLVLRDESWWLVAAPGVLLSQLLVIYSWPDAKAGTVPNVLLAVAVVLAWAGARFQRDGDEAVRTLFGHTKAAPATVVTAAELAPLPPPVRRWLTSAGVVGKPRVYAVRLRQRGRLRTSAQGSFMPVEAEQYFAVDKPGFVWRARVSMMGFVPIAGRDSSIDGKGQMLIAVASLVPVVNATGAKIDQGALLRFLGEIVWFPSAALGKAIRWEAIDDTHARATIDHGGVVASGVFRFDDQGRFLELTAQRYMDAGDDARLEPWVVPAREWREVRGVVIPVKGDVVWRLPAGDFNYFEWEIVDVETDRPELYPAPT